MLPKAVLFDFDGVIVDTENVHIAAWQRTMLRMGWELTDEACAPAAEIDDRAFLAALFATRGMEGADIDGWVRQKQDLAETMLADAPRPFPGVVALVNSLRGEVRLGIVTTTWRRNVTIVLDRLGLADAFEVIVAKEDVARVKPAPDSYTLALKRMGLAPADALAIEDSPTGVASALAAGLRVMAVGHRRPEGEWSVGCRFISELTDARAVLDRFDSRE